LTSRKNWGYNYLKKSEKTGKREETVSRKGNSKKKGKPEERGVNVVRFVGGQRRDMH